MIWRLTLKKRGVLERGRRHAAHSAHGRLRRGARKLAFVNTAKLITNPKVGPLLVRSLVELVAKTETPDFILVPDRARARLLADRVVPVLANLSRGSTAELVLAQRRFGFWQISEDAVRRLTGKSVLVLDSAAGHGCVLDELTLIASQANAHAVSAAVLLSRLTLSCEDAFGHRLSGGFHRLFHLPIRPVGVRTKDRSLCPVCRERALVEQAAEECQQEAFIQLARLNANRRVPKTGGSDPEPAEKSPQQLLLFDVPEPPLLQRCRRSVASGITLHALHTAMTDGMAPLALPELQNSEIPAVNRVAMVEHLPPGAMVWSENHLDQSVEVVLTEGADENVWLACAGMLAREGKAYWIAYLKPFLERSKELHSKPNDSFWNRLAYGAYRVSSFDADIRDEIADITQHLLDRYRETASADGLRRVLDAVTSTPSGKELD
jgi:hypothetical protein